MEDRLKDLSFDALVGMLRENREKSILGNLGVESGSSNYHHCDPLNHEFYLLCEALKDKFTEHCKALYWTHDGNVFNTLRWIELTYLSNPHTKRLNFYAVGQNVEFDKDGVRHVLKPKGTLKFFDGEFDSWDEEDMLF